MADDDEDTRYNSVCRGAYSEYKGKKLCAYNMARAMAETQEFLTKELSPKINDWEWKNVHANEYVNMPWSMTPFKSFFHREIPVGGNVNTVKVSKYSVGKLHNN